jgi:hypothetical protein
MVRFHRVGLLDPWQPTTLGAGTLRNFTWEKHCGGLFELPVAA